MNIKIKISHKGLALQHGKLYSIIVRGESDPVKGLFINSNRIQHSKTRPKELERMPEGHFFLGKIGDKHVFYPLDTIAFAALIPKRVQGDE